MKLIEKEVRGFTPWGSWKMWKEVSLIHVEVSIERRTMLLLLILAIEILGFGARVKLEFRTKPKATKI